MLLLNLNVVTSFTMLLLNLPCCYYIYHVVTTLSMLLLHLLCSYFIALVCDVKAHIEFVITNCIFKPDQL